MFMPIHISSNITPRNLIAFFLSIWFFAIFKSGNFRVKSYLMEFLWKSVYFLLFKDSFFAMNQSPIFSSSSLTFVKSWLMFLWEWNRFVSSENIIGSKILEALFEVININQEQQSPKYRSLRNTKSYLWGSSYFVVEVYDFTSLRFLR